MSLTIDAHHHLWDLSVTPQPWLNDSMGPINRSFVHDDLVDAIDGRVDASIIVQTASSEAETLLMLETAAASPVISGVVGWVDLTADDVAQRIAALVASPNGSLLVGIRHQTHDEPDLNWLGRDDVRRGIASVGAAGLVFELLLRPEHLEVAAAVVADLPDVAFVLDHLAKPNIAEGSLQSWEAELQVLASEPNVTCKVSGLVTEADWQHWAVGDLQPFVDVAVAAFGPERIMFGSDWPVCLLAADYSTVLGAAETLLGSYSAADRAAMFGENAQRIYGLSISPSSDPQKEDGSC